MSLQNCAGTRGLENSAGTQCLKECDSRWLQSLLRGTESCRALQALNIQIPELHARDLRI